jgi:lauroyl/myristoyl acyltransferase
VTAHQRPRLWYTHAYDQPILFHVVAACAPRMPRPLRFGVARLAASLFRQLVPVEYAAAQRNISRILPDAKPPAITHITRSLFRNFAYYFADLLSLNRQPHAVQQRFVEQVHGFEHLQAVLASGRGFVAATAHLGNWELAGRLLSPFGKAVYVLVTPEHHVAVQHLLREHTCPPGLHFVMNDNAGGFVQLLMALRRGNVAAVQVDRGTGHRRDVVADFFGAPASFPSGPFVLAGAARVPVVPFFCLMRPDHRYEIFIDAAIPVVRGHEEEALQQMIRVLEHYVVMAPDQWFNFYDVWDSAAHAR